jgi:hypothetical protein
MEECRQDIRQICILLDCNECQGGKISQIRDRKCQGLMRIAILGKTARAGFIEKPG